MKRIDLIKRQYNNDIVVNRKYVNEFNKVLNEFLTGHVELLNKKEELTQSSVRYYYKITDVNVFDTKEVIYRLTDEINECQDNINKYIKSINIKTKHSNRVNNRPINTYIVSFVDIKDIINPFMDLKTSIVGDSIIIGLNNNK